MKDGVPEVVSVPRGFVVIFSGDCFHCGSEYINTGDNKRLFFKVMPKGHQLARDEKDHVNKKPVKCHLCSAPCDHKRALRDHIRMKCPLAAPEVIVMRAERIKRKREIDNGHKRNNVKRKNM